MDRFPTKAGSSSGFELALYVENSPRPRSPLPGVATAPGSPAEVAVAVRYAFNRGWQYAQAVPQDGAIPAGARALTLWARSSGEGNYLRSRFRDATGQTFQVNLGRLNWSGWQPVSIPLDGSTSGAHWGGADDGIPHAPLSWEGLVLIDSAHRDAPVPGELLIAAPYYVFGE